MTIADAAQVVEAPAAGACAEPVESWELANGLRALFQADIRVPLVAVHASYAVGSRHDPPRRSGLAHLCEHLKFIGGGRATARTFPDRTVFTETRAASDLGFALARERVRMTEHRFAADRLEADCRLLIVERAQTVDGRPFGRDFEEIHQLLYPPGHPYRQSPTGTVEGLRSIGAVDAEELSRVGYRPERALITVVGSLERSTVAEAVERAFADLPGKPWREAPTSCAEPVPASDTPEILTSQVPHPRVYVALRGPGFGRRDCHAASLLLRGLAVGRASPLARRLVDELGVARQVQAHIVPMREASTLVVVVDGLPEVEPRRLAGETLAACEDLVSRPLPEPRLESARRKALTDLWSTLQRPAERAAHFAMLRAFLGQTPSLAEAELHLRTLDAGAVAEVARTLWRTERRAVLTVIPDRSQP